MRADAPAAPGGARPVHVALGAPPHKQSGLAPRSGCAARWHVPVVAWGMTRTLLSTLCAVATCSLLFACGDDQAPRAEVGNGGASTGGISTGTGGTNANTGGVNASRGGAAGSTSASGGHGGVGENRCGGIAGFECPEDMYCYYPLDAACGAGDQMGTCEPKLEVCTARYEPVCGCDGNTYSSACEAAAAGTSVASEGACS